MAPWASQGRPKGSPRPPKATPVSVRGPKLHSSSPCCKHVRKRARAFFAILVFHVFFENDEHECNLGQNALMGPQGPPEECPRPPRFGRGPKITLVFAVLQKHTESTHLFCYLCFCWFLFGNWAPPLTPKGHPRHPRWPPRGAEVAP